LGLGGLVEVSRWPVPTVFNIVGFRILLGRQIGPSQVSKRLDWAQFGGKVRLLVSEALAGKLSGATPGLKREKKRSPGDRAPPEARCKGLGAGLGTPEFHQGVGEKGDPKKKGKKLCGRESRLGFVGMTGEGEMGQSLG